MRFGTLIVSSLLLGLCYACNETPTASLPDGVAGSSAGEAATAAIGEAGAETGGAGSERDTSNAGGVPAATDSAEGGTALVAAAAGEAGIAPVEESGEGGAAPIEASTGEGGATPIEASTGEGGVAPVEAAVGEAGASQTQSASADPSIVPIATMGEVSSLQVAPLTLTPSFSTAVYDYYVRCGASSNALTLTTVDQAGTKSRALNVLPDQAIVVGNTYWIRCLPPDFPITTVAEPGTPTPGYYLLNSLTYGAVFDVRGVPVWYARGNMPINVDSPAQNKLSLMRNAAATGGVTPVYEIRDLAANTVTTIAGPGTPPDDHELRVLDNGNYLVFAYPLETGVDLTGLKSYGNSQAMLDCEIEELDASGQVVWSWLASDHIDPTRESVFSADTTLNGVPVADVFHCNSIEVDPTGNLMISLRHASAIFYLDRSTGRILWKLGGTAYNKDGAALIRLQGDPETDFSLQHDARFQANGDITLFDDHSLETTGFARGVEYSLDFESNTATPVFQYFGSGRSQFEGSFRRYADGESVIGWGYLPGDLRVLTEIDATGANVFDIWFGGANNQSYRAIKVPLTQLDIGLLRKNTAH